MGYRRQALRFVIERDERTGWRWQAVLAVAILLFTTLTLPTLAAPALPIRDLDHLSLHVSDVRRSADFYTRLFGTEVSRDPNRQANPGSVPRELWFIRLGDSHLALAPLSPAERPGIDHFCFAVTGFDRDGMRENLLGFHQPWPDWPSGLWITDSDGRIIQLAASTSAPRLPAIVRDAVLVAPPPGRARQPVFEPRRLTHLGLTSADVATARTFYRRLLGEAAEDSAARFLVGPSRLWLIPSSAQDYFQVGIADFDVNAVLAKLSAVGVVGNALEDRGAVWFADPDGIRVRIGGI